MKRLVFIGPQRKLIRFHIDKEKVIYFDDIWKDGVQIYPKDEKLIKELINSGKQNLRMLAALILDANKGKELEQYLECKGDEEKIALIIRRDCKSRGLMEVK